MSGWTTARLNFLYHWKTALVWLCVSVLVLLLLLLRTPAKAWVEGYQPFPEGEATVVLPAFCPGGCFFTEEEWSGFIRDALRAWNTAGADFTFHTRRRQPGDDPCNLPNEVVIISYRGQETVCPGDSFPVIRGPVGLTEFRLDGARIYLKAGIVTLPGLLLHELGHVVGLGHPDEAGQNVQSIMNSHVTHSTLQPDDIAGIRALYPLDTARPTLQRLLENPAPNSFQSGIGVISGWACEANQVLIDIRKATGNDGRGSRQVAVLEAVYGTDRSDTQGVCGDTNNGFAVLFNWNSLGDGQYEVFAEIDGRRITNRGASVAVTTLGEEFRRNLSGQYVLEGFPSPGESVVVEWSETLQNFVIIERAPNEEGEPVDGLSNNGTDALEIEMVLIPAGTFQMGSPVSEEGRRAREGPIHPVTISQPFYMGKYEVTQAQWRAVMGGNPSQFSNCDACPVDSLTWNDTQDFLRALNLRESDPPYRLPTEAEWEYAARAGTTTAYSFGAEKDRLGLYAWYLDNANEQTHPVGSKRPNAFGLYDVHGNVSEWVQDCWNESYNGAPTDGSAWLSGRCSMRGRRGSSWTFGARHLRTAARRYEIMSGAHDGNSGFRIARSVN